ncbi:hypothetical protein M3J09_012129 [Ascochyta lentis]
MTRAELSVELIRIKFLLQVSGRKSTQRQTPTKLSRYSRFDLSCEKRRKARTSEKACTSPSNERPASRMSRLSIRTNRTYLNGRANTSQHHSSVLAHCTCYAPRQQRHRILGCGLNQQLSVDRVHMYQCYPGWVVDGLLHVR